MPRAQPPASMLAAYLSSQLFKKTVVLYHRGTALLQHPCQCPQPSASSEGARTQRGRARQPARASQPRRLPSLAEPPCRRDWLDEALLSSSRCCRAQAQSTPTGHPGQKTTAQQGGGREARAPPERASPLAASLLIAHHSSLITVPSRLSKPLIAD